MEIRSNALVAAARVVHGILAEGASTSWAENQTVTLAKRLERYLREGT